MKKILHILVIIAYILSVDNFSEAQNNIDTVKNNIISVSDTSFLPIESDYEWITYRGKADISDTGGVRTCNFYVVNRTDSILYINIHAYGSEIARIVFSLDSMVYVNKLTQQYFRDSYQPIRKYLHFDLDFYTVQALFNGQTEKLPQGQKLSFEYLSFAPVSDSTSFFTEFIFKDLNHVLEIHGIIKLIRFNKPGVTSIRIPEKFEQIKL